MSDTQSPKAPDPPRPPDPPPPAEGAARAHGLAATSRLRNSRSRWRFFAFVALALAILAVAARLSPLDTQTDQIARISIEGTIITDRARRQMIAELAEDDQVKAVIVTINSPGGSTAGGEELYQALTELRMRKPVVAVVKELGASAAYMAAIAADRIFAGNLSIVGSIGVLYQHVNAGRLLDIIGIDLEKIASGPLKAEPDLDEGFSPEVRASIEALVLDSYAWFVDAVAFRRQLSREDALAVSDGRIVTGRMGLVLDLIDELGGEDDAIAWLESEHDVAADLPVYTWQPRGLSDLERFAQFFGEQGRAALGLPPQGPLVLDGLVSLWQAAPSL